MFTRKVVIDVFGGSPECTNGVHVAAEPHSRASYNKFLLSDDGCTSMTQRMQEKIAQLVSSLPSDHTVEMVKFFNRIIYTASAAALFTDDFALDDKVFESFINFDDIFALALAGFPSCVLGKGIEGTRVLIRQFKM